MKADEAFGQKRFGYVRSGDDYESRSRKGGDDSCRKRACTRLSRARARGERSGSRFADGEETCRKIGERQNENERTDRLL